MESARGGLVICFSLTSIHQLIAVMTDGGVYVLSASAFVPVYGIHPVSICLSFVTAAMYATTPNYPKRFLSDSDSFSLSCHISYKSRPPTSLVPASSILKALPFLIPPFLTLP